MYMELSQLLSLFTVLLWDVQVISTLDLSTLIPCGNVGFPELGSGLQVCFERVFTEDPHTSTCDLIHLETRPIEVLGNTIKIFSPNFGIENSTYPNNILCQYSLPQCPNQNSLVHISWFSELFILQPPQPFGPFEVCSDFLQFFNLPIDLEFLGLNLDDFGTLCDQQGDFFEQFSGSPLQAEFRSGVADTFFGFSIDVVCVPVLELSLNNEDCVVVEGEVQSPSSQPTIVTQEGNGVKVPRPAFVTFRSNVLAIVKSNGGVLRQYSDIRALFFVTRFNGTRVFTDSAPVPLHEIYGGGKLYLTKHVALYVNYMIPPKFEPNSQEKALLATILTASTPFFMDQVISIDQSAAEHRTHGKPMSHQEGLKPEADQEVLKLAHQFANACNPFLREASKSFLEIAST